MVKVIRHEDYPQDVEAQYPGFIDRLQQVPGLLFIALYPDHIPFGFFPDKSIIYQGWEYNTLKKRPPDHEHSLIFDELYQGPRLPLNYNEDV